MAVNISGTVLASLFYDNSSSIGDQTGFLVGDVVHHVKDTISDSQINNVEVKTKTYVFDCIPCPRDQLFHDTSGEILRQKIIDLLPDKHQSIVGWYSFRRNSTIRPSFRERLLHYNLTHALGQDENMFLFLLCSSRASTNKSTHTFDHSFIRLDNNIFKKVPVDITNLGDTTHAEYRCALSHTVASKIGAFSKIVKTHEGEFLNPHGNMEVRQIQMLNGAIRKQLDNISQSVIDSEAKCSDLEQEVAQFRKRAKLKLLEKEQQQQSLLQQNVPQVKKGPSVDDILSMDQVDDLPSEILLGHGQSKRTTGQRASVKVSTEIESDQEQKMDTSLSGCNEGVGGKENQPFKVKLTTPVVLHTRSSSTPVDTPSASSQLNVSRTRSKSGDANVDVKKEQKVKTDINDVKCKTAKNSDPFAFVGSMLAESKRDTEKFSNTRKTKNDELDTDVAMETEDSILNKHVNHKQTRHNTGATASAARTLNQSPRTTRSQRFKGRESDTEASITSLDTDSSVEEFNEKGGNHTFEKTKQNRESTRNMKTCGQEVGQKQQIEIETDESSCSQDTYEMDVSSSPVY